jgi:hypothetical protein
VSGADIACDAEKMKDSYAFGGQSTGCEVDGKRAGAGFDLRNGVYYNSWYAEQGLYPGTPLWPSGAKSEFGMCCGLQLATFGTNG